MKLKQIPIIEQNIKNIAIELKKEIADYNIDNLIATEDSIKYLKSVSADLNKRLTIFEDQRKELKNSLLNPYNEIESIYNDELKTVLMQNISTLRDKINNFELKLKEEIRNGLLLYFNELKSFHELDFINFDQACIKINLSTSEKKLQEECLTFINKVLDDIELINQLEDKNDILVEYKSNLNASISIKTVKERKEKLKKEIEAQKNKTLENRKSKLLNEGFYYDPSKLSFIGTNKIISNTQVETFNDDDFLNLFKEVKLSKPIESEILTAQFEITGSLDQLKLVKEFLTSNNIIFKSI